MLHHCMGAVQYTAMSCAQLRFDSEVGLNYPLKQEGVDSEQPFLCVWRGGEGGRSARFRLITDARRRCKL